MAKRKPTKDCTCAHQADLQLEPHNARLQRDFLIDTTKGTIDNSPLIIATEKIDKKKRGKPPTVYASFCPICGKKYCE